MSRVEGADISIQDFLEENRGLLQSNLQRAFDKTSILLTGATSFIGSVILEKLLRSCPDISCIYVLIRSNQKEPVERMKDLFRSPLFDRLKMEKPRAMNKVHVVSCDLKENDLGLSNDDYLMLTTKINAVIHSARLIGSSVKLKEAVLINLKALQNIVKLCQETKKLDAIAYVSSIYAHFNEKIIEEKLYPCTITADCLISMIDNLPEDILEAITPGIAGNYPDISTLTLGIAERILNDKGEGLPLCIIRSPFVLASCNEPISGWILPQRQETPTDILLNVYLGKISSLHCDGRKPVEAVPVDKIANLTIAAVGNLLIRRKEWINQAVIISNNMKRDLTTQADFQDIQIYNAILSNKQNLTWSDFFKKSIQHEEDVPFLDTTWSSSLKMNRYWIVHWIMTWLRFGQIVTFDQVKGILGINNEFVDSIKNQQQMSDRVLKFCKKHWQLKDDNVRNLWDTISESDRNYFDFNLKSFDWNQFFYTQCRGLRVYLMNDPLSTVPDANKKRQRLKNKYNLLISSVIITILFILYKYLSS